MSYAHDDLREFSGLIFTGFPPKMKIVKRHGQLRKIKQSSLTLVGLGSIGSYVLPSLVQAGIGKIRVIDHDKVKKKDVELGSYSKNDVRKSRCKVFQDRLHRFARQTDFEWYPSEIKSLSAESIFGDSDLIMLCSDTPSPLLHNYLNEVCLKYKKNWLSARFCGDSGEVGPAVIPYKTSCYKCYEYRLRSCQEVKIMPTELVKPKENHPNINMIFRIIGAYASLEAVKMLTRFETPVTLGNLLSIGLEDYTNTLHMVLKVPNCPVCGGQ